MAKDAMTYEDIMEFQRISDEIDMINETRLCGSVVSITELPKSQRTDGKGVAILDDNNNPTFYDSMYWVVIGLLGDEDGVVLSAEQLNDIEVGKKYVFVGKRKNRKFRPTQIISKADYLGQSFERFRSGK